MSTGARVVRIGGASAMLGDTPSAVPQLLAADPRPDYLVMDYLAELTMSFLSRAKAKRPEAGYARYFTENIWRDNVAALAQTGVKVVTNAGGLNPRSCRDRMLEIAAEQGVTIRIAVVDGDDVEDELDALAKEEALAAFASGSTELPQHVLSANAYLGARPIVEALASGADVVITGRVVDSALALGVLAHEFGWSPDDHDLMAAGSLVGHVLECGAQASGGLFTDWEDVPDWAHIGYPVAECAADGSFVVTKPAGTGGLVSTGTVSEQVLYEIGDPQAYVLPDVVCDFSQVQVRQVGENRVQVTGARGLPPTTQYKLCVTYSDGWRTMAVIPVIGMQADAKARRQADAMLERYAETLAAKGFPPLRAYRVDILGTEATYDHRAQVSSSREVVCKLAIEHDDGEALDLFLQEVNAHTTSMAVGSTGWFASPPSRMPVVRVASFLLDKGRVPSRVSLGGEEWEAVVPAGSPLELEKIPRPEVADADGAGVRRVRLVDVAHGRSGDKGQDFNVGIIARRPEYLPYIRAALTEAAVAAFFAEDFDDLDRPRVSRYDLPGLNALNFVCHDALGGGQMASLRPDPLGKGKAQQLLEFELTVPAL